MAQTVNNLLAMHETGVASLSLIPESDPWVRKIPWRREWPPTPVFLLGEFHGKRRLVG